MRVTTALLVLALPSAAFAQIPGAGLRLWLRADAGVATTGALVDTWTDQSGAGHVFTATGTERPTLINEAGGSQLLRFGASQQLSADLGFSLQTATIFSLFRYRGASNNDYLYAFGNAGSSGSQMTLSRRTGGRAYHYDGSVQNVQGAIPQELWAVSTQLYGATGVGSHELRIDGATQILSNATGYNADLATARIGNWTSGSFRFRGDLLDLIIYDHVLSGPEIATVESWLSGRADLARTLEFGTGCAGSNGVPHLRSVPGSLPVLGTTFSTETVAIPSSAPVFLFLGFSDTVYLGLNLPLGLGGIGLPQCELYVSGDVVIPIPNVGGTATWSVVIPTQPVFMRTCIHLQSIVVDPLANPVGLTFSNALTATLGN